MKISYSIGEFSQITGLSPKTLRFYHERGILVPKSVDPASGYRIYDESQMETARVIMRLRQMEFSIDDIGAVFRECDDDANVLDYLERKKQSLQQRITEDRDIVRSLTQIIDSEKAAGHLLRAGNFAVEEKQIGPMLLAGMRMKGKYSDVGAGFSRLGKAVGRFICGKPLCLYYDGEYREEDANIEPCFPISNRVDRDGITIHEIAPGRVLSLIHAGQYDQLGRSYAKLLGAANERKVNIALPTREIYIKGPGMIFKGNPRNYLTEIQLPLSS
jgi:DNA-binding transcriptional MerR regulator/effector-binding domain-containing protein